MRIYFRFSYGIKYSAELCQAVARCTQQAVAGRALDICFISNGVRNSAFTDAGTAG